ncbi:MAG: hypothetical protein PQJ46_15790 [Spirochaetales bacterium]|nr:hypothetical protein [Spirochaetales bacterium]
MDKSAGEMMRKGLFLFFGIISVMFLFSCQNDKKIWFNKLSAADKKEFTSGDIPEERIKNLKKGIESYQKEADRTVKATKQIGIYYRMIALEYMSLEMYGEALKSFEMAIQYFPTSPMLYYKAAVAAGQMTLAVYDADDDSYYFDKSEKYYKRAITLDANYKEALYGLSVLYIFELNKPLDAEPLLEHLCDISKSNFDARFLLARVKVLKGDTDSAVDLYSYIEENSRDDEMRIKAKENRINVLGGLGRDR